MFVSTISLEFRVFLYFLKICLGVMLPCLRRRFDDEWSRQESVGNWTDQEKETVGRCPSS